MSNEPQLPDFNKCCRTCLTEASTDNMVDIFGETNGSNVADMLAFCTLIKIIKEDSLPEKLCNKCYNCLINFYNFRKLALENDVKLHTQLNAKRNETFQFKIETCDIKSESNIDSNIDYDNTEQEFDVCKNEDKEFDLVIDNEDVMVKSANTVNKKHKISVKLGCDSQFQRHILKHAPTHTSLNGFHQKTEFTKHLKPHNDETNACLSELDQNENQNFKCDTCFVNFKSLNSLSAHKRVHTMKGRILACTHCGKVFKKLSHLKRHELIHDINKPFKCNSCSKSFTSELLLTEHLNKHNGVKSHTCPLCNKAFAHLSTLSTHIKIHKKEKHYLCPTCGKRFDSSTNLNQHLNRHLGLKLFACKLCPRTFVTKGELGSHNITHTGEKKHSCDECGATFTKNSSLRKHKLVHLGIKPHQCEKCQMRFTCKAHLQRHYRIHTGEKPYQCDICSRAFTQSNDLVKHKRAHLGDKLYKCDQCTESFRLKTELRFHLSKHFIASQMARLNISDGYNINADGSGVLNEEKHSTIHGVSTTSEVMGTKLE